MVKTVFCPFFRSVARVADFPQLRFMYVIRFMTCMAIVCGFPVFVATLVATGAWCLAMFSRK
jgi:hypothetical protein